MRRTVVDAGRFFLSVLGALALSVVFTSDAAAQTPLRGRDTDWRSFKKVPLVVAPPPVELLRREAIPFRPFAMIRPGTGGPIAPAEMLTLPDGRRVSAGEFYKDLDRVERDLNAMGYTLRSRERVQVLQYSKIDRGLLDRQRALILRMARPRVPVRVNSQLLAPANRLPVQVAIREPSPDVLRLATERSAKIIRLPTAAVQKWIEDGQFALGVDTDLGAAFNSRTPDRFHKEFGDPKIASAYFGAGLVHSLDGEFVRLGANASAGITLVGKQFKLLDADLLGSAGTKRNGARLKMAVAGNDLIPPFDESADGPYAKNAGNEKAIEESVGFTLPIGPIPVSVNFGARGKIGFDSRFVVNQRAVQVGFSPYMQVNAFLEAGVDLVIAGAGVYGDLTLIRDSLNVEGAIGVRGHFEPPLQIAGYERFDGKIVRPYNEATRPYLFLWYGADNDLTLFSGSAGVYAFIYLPCVCWDVFEKHEFRHQLVGWDGLNLNTRVFGKDEERLYFTRPLTPEDIAKLRTQTRHAALYGRDTATMVKPPAVQRPATSATERAAVTPLPATTDRPAAIVRPGAAPKPAALATERQALNLRPPQRIERGINRPGGDYRNISTVSVEQCQAACQGEAQCRAWTWVAPGVQGPQAQCWLKSTVPAPIAGNCCTSGTK